VDREGRRELACVCRALCTTRHDTHTSGESCGWELPGGFLLPAPRPGFAEERCILWARGLFGEHRRQVRNGRRERRWRLQCRERRVWRGRGRSAGWARAPEMAHTMHDTNFGTGFFGVCVCVCVCVCVLFFVFFLFLFSFLFCF
jgi:hypothetical protein